MANPLLGQILAGVFANAMRGRARTGPFGANANVGGGGLGDLLGGMMGRTSGRPTGRAGGAALLAVLLPLAMQWVQRNGGVGAVLERFRQKGYGGHADSWVSTEPNQMIDADAVHNVVGGDELSRFGQQLGASEEDVAAGFAQILPEMVDQLSPEGNIPPEADDALDAGQSELQRELSQLTTTAGM
jgi:uncharacterized protein YidB (DUF937 family)